MRKRQIIGTLLAATMALSTMGGFAVSASEEEDTYRPDLPELPGGVLELEVAIPDFQIPSEGTEIQQLWQEKMEEYLGVKLDITWVKAPYNDFRGQEMILLQTNDVSDISTYTQGDAIIEYGEQGVVLNLADYKDYLHYYMDYVNGGYAGLPYATTEDGSMYYFMNGFYNPDNIEGAQSFTAFAYRFDELKKNNLQPATTLDEFTQLCADLKALIDDGTIDADYVIMNGGSNDALYRGFVGIFHTWDTLYWTGSEWSFGPIEDNFREMLRYLNSLYEAGYIDPEFATADANATTEKATTGKALICPTLWAGWASSWTGTISGIIDGGEWGLAYLPDGGYGTPWKWGSRQPGKSLDSQTGIYISAECEHPEYAVALVDYQYSDEIVNLLNWGVEGEHYTVDEEGNKTYVDEIMNAENPATKSAEYGLMSSSVCRSGIPFVPLENNAMTILSSGDEAWWSPEDGYFRSKYWIETSRQGGPESMSPFNQPAVTYLTGDEATAKSELTRACEGYAKQYGYQFIVGELDIDSDDDWNEYVETLKSQSPEDFDEVIAMLNENAVTE